MNSKEIMQGMSKGEWQNDRGYRIHSKGWIAQTCGMEMPSPNSEERANAHAIVTAVNATYGKGLDPEKYEEVVGIVTGLEQNDIFAAEYPATYSHIRSLLNLVRL